MLYVQTDRATVTALDAETGHQLWAKDSRTAAIFPACPWRPDGDLLAMVNGSHVYVCNRYNGQLLYQDQVAGSPSGSPA